MKTTQGLGNLNQIPLPSSPGQNSNATGNASTQKNSEAAADFRKALDQVGSQGSANLVGAGRPNAGGPASALATPQNPGAGSVSQLKFSNHAVERMHSRGISFSPEQVQKLEGAVEKAAQKGSKDTLVLSGDNAFIVSVKNKTVVTVMDKNTMKDNVFTNIDSTIMI